MKYAFFILLYLAVLTGSCSKPDMTVAPPPGAVAVSTINNYLNNNFEFSLFAAAVAKCGLADSLGRLDLLCTVFAVTNEGFAGMGIYEPSDLDKWKADSLQTFVNTHILQGRVLYNDIPRSLDTRFKNMNGDDLFVSFYKVTYNGNYDNLAINGVNAIPNPSLDFNAPASFGVSLLNGMVYPVRTAIKTSRMDIQTYLASRGDMSIFIAGLKKFDQWERLKNESPITVMAPPDSVFLRYGITADSINRMNKAQFKTVFMDSYIITLNRIFQSDVFSNLNRANAPLIPNTFPPLLTIPTSDSNLVLTMLGNFGPYFGTFVFDRSREEYMPGEFGVTFWMYRILGSEAESRPVYGDDTRGYNVPYVGESKVAGLPLRGAYINYSLSNGVVHLLSGLLMLPEDAAK
jgi:uncharacterized surface protein with fasciclin (FAS1) repeats